MHLMAPRNIVHGQAPSLCPLKMGKPLFFFRQARNKIHFTKSPHIKVVLVDKLRVGESVIIHGITHHVTQLKAH